MNYKVNSEENGIILHILGKMNVEIADRLTLFVETLLHI